MMSNNNTDDNNIIPQPSLSEYDIMYQLFSCIVNWKLVWSTNGYHPKVDGPHLSAPVWKKHGRAAEPFASLGSWGLSHSAQDGQAGTASPHPWRRYPLADGKRQMVLADFKPGPFGLVRHRMKRPISDKGRLETTWNHWSFQRPKSSIHVSKLCNAETRAPTGKDDVFCGALQPPSL